MSVGCERLVGIGFRVGWGMKRGKRERCWTVLARVYFEISVGGRTRSLFPFLVLEERTIQMQAQRSIFPW